MTDTGSVRYDMVANSVTAVIKEERWNLERIHKRDFDEIQIGATSMPSPDAKPDRSGCHGLRDVDAFT
jgi:hypothetical protein